MDNEKVFLCSTSIFCFISFINHSRHVNTYRDFVGPTMHVMYANRDIKKGEEITIDYAEGADN